MTVELTGMEYIARARARNISRARGGICQEKKGEKERKKREKRRKKGEKREKKGRKKEEKKKKGEKEHLEYIYLGPEYIFKFYFLLEYIKLTANIRNILPGI